MHNTNPMRQTPVLLHKTDSHCQVTDIGRQYRHLFLTAPSPSSTSHTLGHDGLHVCHLLAKHTWIMHYLHCGMLFKALRKDGSIPLVLLHPDWQCAYASQCQKAFQCPRHAPADRATLPQSLPTKMPWPSPLQFIGSLCNGMQDGGA